MRKYDVKCDSCNYREKDKLMTFAEAHYYWLCPECGKWRLGVVDLKVEGINRYFVTTCNLESEEETV